MGIGGSLAFADKGDLGVRPDLGEGKAGIYPPAYKFRCRIFKVFSTLPGKILPDAGAFLYFSRVLKS